MHVLAGVDLNLIVALHALLEEPTVTAAARRVGLSQPAMSHALGRLREHFDDPLLVRTGRRMVPTARALALREQLRPMVRQLEGLMTPEPPALATVEMTLRLVTDDAVGCAWLPQVLRALQQRAPGVELDISQRGPPGRKARLRRGEVDLALGHFSSAGLDLHRVELRREAWACALRGGHPALKGAWTLARWAALEHAIVSPTGGRRGEVDRLLEARGLSRRVRVSAPHFSTALALVAETDLVLTTYASVARRLAPSFGLALRPPPLAMPDFPVHLLWHPRTDSDPAQRWLRGVIAETISAA